MIGSLRGRLLERGTDEVLIEVGGIGYRVTVTPATVLTLGDVGDEVFVFVHDHVREDAHTLYGFGTRDERLCFEALLGAHGVGPALALAICSVHPPASLRRTLLDDDVAALCLVPGVGRKTAARLLLELKPRIAGIELDGPTVAAVTGSATAAQAANAFAGGSPGSGTTAARADVRQALAELGYGPDEVRAALAELPESDDPGTLLRAALRHLAPPARASRAG